MRIAGRRTKNRRSATVRARVIDARNRQTDRYRETPVRVNAGLSGPTFRHHCRLDKAGARLLERAIRRLALSARGYDRVLKVARTIADLADAEEIEPVHLAEALQYRLVVA